MQEENSDINLKPQEEKTGNGCVSCNSLLVEEGYTTKLCHSCRSKLLKHSFPRWVKGFFLVVILCLGYELFRFPEIFGDGISYARAKKYEENKKFVSAQRIYTELTDKYPYSSEILVRLYACSYQNMDFIQSVNTLDILIKRDSKDQDIINEANFISSSFEKYYVPSEGFLKIINDSLSKDSLLKAVENYTSCNPYEFYPVDFLYNLYFSRRQYDKCIQISNDAVKRDPEFIYGYCLLAAAEREKLDFVLARQHTQKVLETNSESAAGLSTLAKIELKAGNNKKGLELMQQAADLYGKNDLNMNLSLALAYHFNDNQAKADEILKDERKNISQDEDYYLYIDSIIHGKIQWQIKGK
ncbi:MAG: hypothetical protein V2A54_04920 [Bacteroidota bacterium]